MKIKLVNSQDKKEILDLYLNAEGDKLDFSSLKIDLFIYPYSRQIKAKDFKFFPYEEYISDLEADKRTQYREVESGAEKIFGIGVGLIILLFFYFFNPSDIMSIESIAAVIASYIVSKEIWKDIEHALINATSSKSWRFEGLEYYYTKNQIDTLNDYKEYARKKRYTYESLMPQNLDFLHHSNSKTIKMQFPKEVFNKEEQNNLFHLLSIHLNKDSVEAFHKDQYLFGLKISKVYTFLGCSREKESFQLIDKNQIGILVNDKWISNKLITRFKYVIGRLKIYQKEKLIEDSIIVKN